IAGSGKTVVSLHRARLMAQRNVKDRSKDRVLFLTYGNKLPDVNMRLLKHLTDDGPEVRVVEARSIYSWVGSLLYRQNFKMEVGKPEQIEWFVVQAIDEIKDKYLEQVTLWKRPPDFFQDEIKYR